MSESGAKKRKKVAEAARRHAKLLEKVPKLSTFFVAGSNVASPEARVSRISETPAGMNRTIVDNFLKSWDICSLLVSKRN